MNLNFVFFLLFLFFTIFIGLRHNIGGDYGQYRFIYGLHQEMSFFESLLPSSNSSDPGFGILNWMVHQVDPFESIYWNYFHRVGGYNILNLVCAAIFCLFFLKFAFNLPRPFLILTLSFPYLIIVVSMGYVRQGIAIAIIAQAIIMLGQSRKFWFIALVLLATSIHKSAIIFLPLVAYVSTTNKFLLAIIGVAFFGFVAFVLLASQVERLVSVYIGQEIQSRGAQMRIALLLPSALIYFIYKKNFLFSQNQHKIYSFFSITTLLMFLSVISFASGFSTSLDRIALYYLPFQVMMFSYLPEIFAKKNAFFVTLFIIIYFLLLMTVWLVFADNNSAWVPYKSLLYLDFNSINYVTR
ncbi:EpsG family protein [Gammaproteobacteria bacterium]|nr:EpsG family protein [Gammaproteobacteria bacterium]